MANSTIIGKVKRKLVKELIKDTNIINAIDSPDITKPEKLIGTHIFDYHQNPNTINTALTFITIQVHIPENIRDLHHTFISPVVEIWIISHVNHMIVNNVPKITENRNDYLSRLIDRSLNGQTGLGLGKLELTSNVEGSYQMDYVYRKLTFKGTDINDSFCEDDEENW